MMHQKTVLFSEANGPIFTKISALVDGWSG